MQGISKYLRWLPLYTCCCVFVILSSTAIAVPVRPRRMIHDTYTFDTVASNTISNVTCFQGGIEVQKSTVQCEIKSGCKLIHKTGECCPEYQCKCNHEERVYENGEKIVSSNNPCRRCVCKGGEVTCNDVSCYIRDDCKPRYVKGVCCAVYDNCPAIDDANILPVTKDFDSKPSKGDVIGTLATSTVSSNDRDSILQLANENPLGIKIKEITKPEEIRITDDKPKPFNPFKSTTTTTTTTTIASTTASLDVTTEAESSTITLTTEALKESKELSTEDTNQSSNHGEQDDTDNGVALDNNSSDAPPPAKALVEPEVLIDSGADSNSITDDSGNKNVRQIVEHSTNSSDTDTFSDDVNYFSSTTEMSTESSLLSDTSTTENGEEIDLAASSTPQNVVFVRHGGKTESFHISGTDGLQRVEELEVEASSTTESDNNKNQESTAQDIATFSNDEFSSDVGVESRSSEITSITDDSLATGEPEKFDGNDTIPLAVDKKLDKSLNSNASSIENLSNNSIEVSTLDDGLESSSEFALSSEKVYETVYFPDEKSTTASPFSDKPIDTVYFSTEDSSESASTSESAEMSSRKTAGGFSTTDQSIVSVTESLSTVKSTFSYDEDQDVTPGENPSYPNIPDDFTIHNEQEEKRRLPSKVLDDTIVSSTAGPTCDECDDAVKITEVSSTQEPSDQESKISHKSDVIESRAPSKQNLIPDSERSTTEKVSFNEGSTTLGPNDDVNGFNKTIVSNKNNVEKMDRSAALMLETTVAGIDSDEKYGRKEPTTERSTTKGYANVNDFDDTSSSSQQLENSTADGVSPKDEVESIKKLKSSAEDAITSNESYQNQPLIPNSFQNYLRYLSQINDWPVPGIDSNEKPSRKEHITERSTTKGYVNDFDETSSFSPQSENSTTDGALPSDEVESKEKSESSASDADDDSNESFQNQPLIPNSFQNYFRFLSQTNNWPVAGIASDEKGGRQVSITERSTTKGYVNDFDDSSSSSPQSENSTTDGTVTKGGVESKEKLKSSADVDSNESYENRPIIPNSLQNYWRHLSKNDEGYWAI